MFEKIAKLNYRHRGLVIIASVVLTLACSVGLFSLRMETDPQSLWVSQDSVGYHEEVNFNEQYGAFFRTEQIMLVQNGGKEDNIFDAGHLTSLYFLQTLINKKTVKYENR